MRLVGYTGHPWVTMGRIPIMCMIGICNAESHRGIACFQNPVGLITASHMNQRCTYCSLCTMIPLGTYFCTRHNQPPWIQLENSEFTPNASDIKTALAILAPTRLAWHQEQAGIVPNSCPIAATPSEGDGHGRDQNDWDLSTWQVNQRRDLTAQHVVCGPSTK